ncbi:MAG: primosomal protein N' [Oscillospiraceae bacterium]|nr:primosomal protein N' [Oscillospiraceae bacterium]
MLTAGVAVDKATLDFDMLFSYIVPQNFENEIKTGSIVLVPFGRGNNLRLGIVLSIEEKNDTKGLKSIIDVKNEDHTITTRALDNIKYLKETTFCTWYEAVKTVIPYGALYKVSGNMLSKQMTRHMQTVYTAAENFDVSKLKNEKQKKVYAFLKDSWYNAKQIEINTGVKKGVIDTLIKYGAVVSRQTDRDTSAYAHIEKCRDEVNLSPQQQKVYDEIISCKDNKTHLIHGVTSSGKSMVFIKLIQYALEQGGSAMVLVPEISLTPQMIKLLKEYFGDTVSVIHSRLSHTERLLQYNRALNGQSKVVVGTRSAVFTPLDNLKIIIVDEEHEKSFKSESAPRYSAIRMAQFISKNTGAKLVLASATPSIESYYLATNGWYHLHTMPNRYADLPLPQVEIIDMSQQAYAGDTGPVSKVVLRYLAENIAEGKQSIILINRRGYQTVGVCKDCRQTLKCDDCSVNLVKHKKQNKLICHYCGKIYSIKETCPHCGGEISYSGFGTQHIEEYIQNAIPSARILRMDADSTNQADSHEEMLEAFGKKEYDILIGTQMVAKGLDFEDVNLVCVLGIDSMLNHPGYNSGEQAFNIITQVIGRAGRKSRGAKAVIQTYDSTNPIINMAAAQDYTAFYNGEIAYRKLNTYPPFCTMVTVAFTHTSEATAAKDARSFLDIIRKISPEYSIPLVVLGPVAFDVAMVSKNYRWRLSIKCKNNPTFRQFLNRAIEIYLKNKENKSSVYVNINPLQE